MIFLRGRTEEYKAEIRRRDQAEGEVRRLMLADQQELQQRLALIVAPKYGGKLDTIETPPAGKQGPGGASGKEGKQIEQIRLDPTTEKS